MLFNSTEFLILFVSVFILYWILRDYKHQNVLLLVSSYIFYAWWDWRFLSLILISSIIDYSVGSKIYAARTNRVKRNWLLLSLISNLGLLSVFKYYNFFVDSFAELAKLFGWQPNDLTLNIILPVGISFYTFQTLSYTIDIYRGQFKPTHNFISFCTYIALFPQLVAGPIERASNLLPQVERPRKFKKEWFNEGLVQITIGFIRKIVIADTLGVYVDTIYANTGIYNSTSIILATIFYAFQIYFDFSGYSDIAIGTAKLLGFKFNQNFNLPYFSSSLTEFWRKWHMSLSYWLRDYLYISLGGNRKGIKITYRNLMLTMLLGGLWHGSSWNFVIWGGIHGTVLCVEKFLNSKSLFTSIRKIKLLGFSFTFLVVLFAWVFFRAQTFDSAITAIKQILTFSFGPPYIGNISVMVNSILVLAIGLLIDFYLKYKDIPLEEVGRNYTPYKLSFIISILVIFICLFYSTSQNFIYFQF
ncbi:MBOAT family protein [Muricauda sp. CAU 1631]|uniref:MBOAT family protein n=1 Tax=[Muricauda] lutisoli TaxID=2816035 RepID=A0ABS3EWR2_9FLAO|nr:MBOAT family protein [[Muricauda] lutisoli]